MELREAHTFVQATPAATWTILHGLQRFPAAITIRIGDEEVDTDQDCPDENTLVLTFSSPQTGTVEVI